MKNTILWMFIKSMAQMKRNVTSAFCNGHICWNSSTTTSFSTIGRMTFSQDLMKYWILEIIYHRCNITFIFFQIHYNDVIMGAMASQITSLIIVYSTVYSRRRSKKTSKLRVTGLCAGNSPVTGEFPAQMVSNAENVSIWWRHHVTRQPASRYG